MWTLACALIAKKPPTPFIGQTEGLRTLVEGFFNSLLAGNRFNRPPLLQWKKSPSVVLLATPCLHGFHSSLPEVSPDDLRNLFHSVSFQVGFSSLIARCLLVHHLRT